jgi:uncharacterized protein (TIGR02757 family)
VDKNNKFASRNNNQMKLNRNELREFLNEMVERYNCPDFIESDPISIPHMFTAKEDIEIAGFLAATIAWGNRKMILRNANMLMGIMGHTPYDFIINHTEDDLQKGEFFVHRTFNSTDLKYFFRTLKQIYLNGGMEEIFKKHMTSDSLQPAIHEFRRIFFELPHPSRTEKHVSDPFRGSAAKKINMFLRWMVRKDGKGVDFGIWDSIPMSVLSCPLDVHSGNIAREFGLITRKANDSVSLRELDQNLREMDKDDPVKYDFALFGLGVSGFAYRAH